MRIVVLAYHNVGHACLKHLFDIGEDIVGIVTHRDQPHENIWFRSVADLARSRGLEPITPDDVNVPEIVRTIRDWRPDILFSFYFRQMISNEILGIPPLGCINLHGSLLPKYRGRVPVNWVIIHGETETGVTLHYMVEKPDAGDIISQKKVSIDFRDTGGELFDKITAAAEDLFRETWPQIKAGTAPRVPQDLSEGSYFGGRKPEDGKIDWNQSAVQVYNLVRAVTHPYPGAFSYLHEGKVLIWQAWPLKDCFDAPPGTIAAENGHGGPVVQTGNGALIIHRGQFEGKHELPGTSLIRQGLLRAGDRFETECSRRSRRTP